MSVIISDEQKKAIDTIARKNGFTGNFEVNANPGSMKGDNYMGIITRVTIKQNERKLELVIKSATTNEAIRKVVPIHKAFRREIYIYELFKEFKRFQDEYSISHPFSAYPASYETSVVDGSEYLVMENLFENGYTLWNRKIPMTPQHISAVVVEYAKFHAVSLALKNKKPELFEELSRDLEEHVFESEMNESTRLETFVKGIIENGSKALEDYQELLEILQKLGVSGTDYFLKEIKNPKWNLVINHGDSWCNNLMFQYEVSKNTTKVSKVCILDWQVSKMGSPAADLAYLFFTNSPKEVLYDYQKYLDLYYDTICQNLKEFSCDPDEIFPYSLLEEHWRKFIRFGVYMALMMIKTMYCDSDEAPDFAKMTDSGEDCLTSVTFDFRNVEAYNQRIKILMRFLVESGLLT